MNRILSLSLLLSITLSGINGISQTDLANSSDLVSGDPGKNSAPVMGMPDSVKTMSIALLANQDFEITPAPCRPFYNHSFKFSAGYSLNTLRLDNSMRVYNDTSEHVFRIENHSPLFSVGHTIALDSTFSLGYTLAYANSEIYFDNQYYGSQFFYVSLNPQVHILRTYNFEYYVKLKIGLSYDYNHLRDMVPSERLQNQYPTGFHMFTGFTFAGVNYLINDHLALNAEFSIWSPETANVGLSYRFFKQRQKTPAMDMQFAY
ncbi:MAG: hypothetical protein HYZ14_01935 [Bacteroidetes bacterium]|nr:hypothetical protein [Bacteroidota bacterium]